VSDQSDDAPVSITGAQRVNQVIHSGDQAAWSTAALVVGLSGIGTDSHKRAATEVLRALGIDMQDGLDGLDRRAAAAQAAAPLLQAGGLLTGGGQIWAQQSDEALLAQGRASAGGAAPVAELGFPYLAGLTEALGRPGARMLDVGTGVGALAVAYAELFPALTVVGLDVLPRVLALAEVTVAAAGVADRVVLRQQDLSTLQEDSEYALAWLPAPFVTEAALRAGAPRVARALVPGGWLMLAHGKYRGDPFEDALNRFKTVIYGGTALDDEGARSLLDSAGLREVMTLPTPLAAPAISVGRRVE